MTLMPCSLANASKSGMRDMVPSVLISSVITPAGYSPARIARSTAASVWPARVSTPPSAARSGNVWPGIEKSEAFADGSRTFRIVARHEADVLGRDKLCGDDEIALVLAVFVVYDDDELARLESSDRLRYGGQAHLPDECYRWRFRAT